MLNYSLTQHFLKVTGYIFTILVINNSIKNLHKIQ